MFDAYGTLFDFASAASRCRDSLGDKFDRLNALWREKQLQYTWLRAIQGAHADFWKVTGDALDFAMDSLELRDGTLRDRLMALYLELETFPEVSSYTHTLEGVRIKDGNSFQWFTLHAAERSSNTTESVIYSTAYSRSKKLASTNHTRRRMRWQASGSAWTAGRILFVVGERVGCVCGVRLSACGWHGAIVTVNARSDCPAVRIVRCSALTDLPAIIGA